MNNKKEIKELTEDEARKIFEYVFKGKDYTFKCLTLDKPQADENGMVQITFGGRIPIGIEYWNSYPDLCVLHLDNTKAIKCLYEMGYDIQEFLEMNEYMSEMENDFVSLTFAVEDLSKGEEIFRDGYKHNWTLDYVKNKCKELLQKYCFKNY